MKLNILSRLNIARLFPRESGILQQMLVKSIAKKVEFSKEEIERIKLRQEGENIVWEPKNDFEKDIDFTDAEVQLLRDMVDLIDREKRITQDMLDICLLIRNSERKEVSV